VNLPILDIKDKIISSLKAKNRLILSAPTGSGKSTQVPQFALEANLPPGRILVLEPRRIAARMLAARVAGERGSPLGAEVGFQTRFENAFTGDTRILFVTEGVLPRKLLGDPDLGGVSTVIFDEFHERSLTTDLGLALMRRLQEEGRPELRLVVMSATLEAEALAGYLPDAQVVASEGRMHPVEQHYLPSGPETQPWDAAVNAVRRLLRLGAEGDILIFMPGAYEIRKTLEALKTARLPESCEMMSLYGDLPWEQQKRVMEKSSVRKIIVATNIAETSLTIPNVRHVVDSGLARVNRYDPGRGFNTLYVESISRASADQRAGRAGREGPGLCMRLWSEATHGQRATFTPPEVSRVDLSEAVLNIAVLGAGDPARFPWFEAPPAQALAGAQELLLELGALTPEGALTEEGRAMAALPAHPRLAKLLLESVRRGIAHKGALAAAILSERPATSGRPDLADRSELTRGESDFEALEYLFSRAESSGFSPAVCLRLGVNAGAARQVLRAQAYFVGLLRRLRMDSHAAQKDPQALSKALLLAYPDRLARWRDNGTLQYVLQGEKSGELSADSAARGAWLIVSADIREVRNRGQQARTVLSLACGVDEEWLLEFFPDRWRSETQAVWNPSRQAVEKRTRTWCLEVLIEETARDDADPAEASALLAETILEKGLKLEGFDEETEEYLQRVRWLAAIFPGEGLPHFGEEEKRGLIRQLCEGETRYSAVKRKPVLPALRQLLGAKQHFVETMAPSYLQLPNGRRMPIVYTPGQDPKGRTRIQDLYGMSETPAVAGGRVKVLIEILAPNNRPVQVTNDLAGFWERHYPELKKALSRRYPKHEWR
jgi:ATP-dependent helicase HrpB